MALPALITDGELLELSFAANALAGVAVDVRDAHRQAASDTVRSKLAPRVSAAVSAGYTPGSDVKGAVAAIASYTLLAYRGYSPEAGADKSVQARYETALAWLEDVRNCRAEPIEGGAIDRGAPKIASASPPDWLNWRGRRFRRYFF